MVRRNKALKSAIAWVGIRHQDLADGVGVKENDISLFITGRKQPSPVVAMRIAEILKAEKEKLFPELFLEEAKEVEK